MGESVLNNLIDLQMFILRWHIEQENRLFWLCIEGGILIIADSTKNKYLYNCTEEFLYWTRFSRVIRRVNSTVCKFIKLIVIILGTE